jgi:hypothetical protein
MKKKTNKPVTVEGLTIGIIKDSDYIAPHITVQFGKDGFRAIGQAFSNKEDLLDAIKDSVSNLLPPLELSDQVASNFVAQLTNSYRADYFVDDKYCRVSKDALASAISETWGYALHPDELKLHAQSKHGFLVQFESDFYPEFRGRDFAIFDRGYISEVADEFTNVSRKEALKKFKKWKGI